MMGHSAIKFAAERAAPFDRDPKRQAAMKLCQDALDGWLALPEEAHPNTVATARRKLREALGLLGAVTGRR